MLLLFLIPHPLPSFYSFPFSSFFPSFPFLYSSFPSFLLPLPLPLPSFSPNFNQLFQQTVCLFFASVSSEANNLHSPAEKMRKKGGIRKKKTKTDAEKKKWTLHSFPFKIKIGYMMKMRDNSCQSIIHRLSKIRFEIQFWGLEERKNILFIYFNVSHQRKIIDQRMRKVWA